MNENTVPLKTNGNVSKPCVSANVMELVLFFFAQYFKPESQWRSEKIVEVEIKDRKVFRLQFASGDVMAIGSSSSGKPTLIKNGTFLIEPLSPTR